MHITATALLDEEAEEEEELINPHMKNICEEGYVFKIYNKLSSARPDMFGTWKNYIENYITDEFFL